MHAVRHGRIEMAMIEEGCWRICDASMPPDDPRRVIAYIESDDDGVDVLWLSGDRRPARYGTLEDALAAADARVVTAPGEDRASRPVPIPHFPPPRAASVLRTKGRAAPPSIEA
ncbi:hypothetical protein M4I32_07885 [Microbacterium sp. LRZ72]|uniref:hypothetical protein n=1 Tax=Microbacterium sp. LRZ72 TaxID=2942481 RepID=UPI0029BCB1EF|nr:hypothetical protein [Microbacterium sp. LRZ72]MDX2376718.1 hypothetical protein [Microbacterium sp. LRZ72]